MKKKFIIFTSLVVILLLFCSCTKTNTPKNTPSLTVDSFLKAIQKQDYSSTESYYSENMDNISNFRNQVEEISPHVATELFNKMSHFTYTIHQEKIDPQNPEHATVNVTIEAYDLGKAFEKTILDYIKSDIEMTFDGSKSDEIIKNAETTIIKELTHAEQKFSTTVDISVTKENDTWKLNKVSDNPELLNALSGNIIATINRLLSQVNP